MGACDGGCYTTTCPSLVNPKEFDAIDGTPLKKLQNGSWVQGKVTEESCFYDILVSWIQTLRFFSSAYGGSGLSTLKWVGNAGGRVCKSTSSCHNKGRALDLSKVVWNGVTVDMYGGDHASTNRTKRRRYLAVDACCRRYFKYTLDGWYDAAHSGHIHVDNDRVPVLDKQSESDTKFVQAVCNNFNGAGLAIDGVWGQRTQDAWVALNRAWDYRLTKCDPFTTEVAYSDWCNYVMAHGFRDAGANSAVYRSQLCGPS